MNSNDISVCTIATPQDLAFVEKLRTPLPVFCQKIVMTNEQSEEDSLHFFELKDGVQIFNCTYTGDLHFSDLRNKCMSVAYSEWLFWQDADDMLCLSDAEYNEIISLPEDIYGIEVPVLLFNSDTDMFYISYQIKIHRKLPAIQFEYACHETVRECFERNNLKYIRKNYLIKHYGYEDKERYREHLLRNRDLLIKDIALNYPDNEYLLEKLKQTLNELSQ